MPTVEERLATLEEKVDNQHSVLVEIKLLLEGLQPYRIEAARVQEWQTGVAEDIDVLRKGHGKLKERVTALEMWRSYLLGGMSVIMALGATGLITALVNYLGKGP